MCPDDVAEWVQKDHGKEGKVGGGEEGGGGAGSGRGSGDEGGVGKV